MLCPASMDQGSLSPCRGISIRVAPGLMFLDGIDTIVRGGASRVLAADMMRVN